MKNNYSMILGIAAAWVSVSCMGAREDVLKPYDGPSKAGIDASTLTGKVITGYQGWFNCPGDGSGLGWVHWARDRFEPGGHITVDGWPDVSEYDEDELYDTGFTYEDGTVAKVFSSHNRKTVIRHIEWMAEYGIDGTFLQRFSSELPDEKLFYHRNKVLSSVREGANRHGVTYAVMYDLSSTPDDQIVSRVFGDWRMLREKMEITKDPAYQHHNGKPLVAVWGVGFNGQIKKRPDFDECVKLIKKLKEDGCSIMLGTPTGWREQDRDASQREDLHEFLLLADVISPWSVGRFGTIGGAQKHADQYWSKDIAWSREHDIDYMPVVFPGFSWYNLRQGKSPLAHIPRQQGKFFWKQIVENKKAGTDMIYLAMFDEVDESTSIFKQSDNPPMGNGGTFLGMEGVPSDFYLQIAGKTGELLRDEIPVTDEVPVKLD